MHEIFYSLDGENTVICIFKPEKVLLVL